MIGNECLYLVSSSASERYVTDCLDVLALPRGIIQHFRYRMKYLDPELEELIPKNPGSLPSRLQDVQVVVLFVLAQIAPGDNWPGDEWQNPSPHVPLRCGRLVDAYAEGDVAHFFFAVEGYVSYWRPEGEAAAPEKGPRAKVKGIVGKAFARLAPRLLEGGQETDDSRDFQSFVKDGYVPEEWRTVVAGTTPLDVTYQVIFFRVAGIFSEGPVNGRSELRPVPTQQRHLPGWPIAEYSLRPGVPHHIKVVTHILAPSPAALPGGGLAELRLDANPEFFETPGATVARISSAYDLWYWPVVPRIGSPSRSQLTITCHHNPPSDDDPSFVRAQVISATVTLPVVSANLNSKV